ncbi:hypothetical protein ACHAWF_000402 [Thalassiosira exigua]
MTDIDKFVGSIQKGSEGFILMDEGNINKFLGIDIRQLDNNKFKMAQPFLIGRIVSLLGLENNEFEVDAMPRQRLLGKPLLNKDLEGKPHLKSLWHKLCHKKAIMRIGQYFLHTRDRGIVFNPDTSKGLE